MKHQKDEIASVWDKVSLNYNIGDYWKSPENRANLEVLLLHIGNPESKRIIEVGCGSGLTSLALAQQGAKCALLDLSPEALRIAAAEFTKVGLPVPELFNQDALKNTLPSDAFDVSWNGGVIEHFYDSGKELLVQEMLRITKPGGSVIVLVPNAACWHFQIVQAWMKLRGTWVYGFEDDMSPWRLRRMCRRLGIANFTTYAYNTALAWRWIPRVGCRMARLMGWEDLKYHRRRSWMGFVSVLVIVKERKTA